MERAAQLRALQSAIRRKCQHPGPITYIDLMEALDEAIEDAANQEWEDDMGDDL